MASTHAACAVAGPPTRIRAVHRLQRAGGVVIELKVGFLRRAPGPEIDVRLIPDFEVPTGDLVDAVAIDQVLGEGA